MRPLSIIRRARERLPVKLKLAIVSAGLTFAILLLFAVVVGAFAERRLNASFDDEVRATAADLQEQIRVSEAGRAAASLGASTRSRGPAGP